MCNLWFGNSIYAKGPLPRPRIIAAGGVVKAGVWPIKKPLNQIPTGIVYPWNIISVNLRLDWHLTDVNTYKDTLTDVSRLWRKAGRIRLQSGC